MEAEILQIVDVAGSVIDSAEAVQGSSDEGGVTMETWISLGCVFFLLILSGCFSGSETAMTAASQARMTGLEKEGNKRAALVNKIREKKDRLIGALLLGNNLVNILASAIATSVLIKLFGEAGVVYATLGMTLLVLIFAEVLPKTYALHFADKMAMSIAPIMNILVIVFSPITEMISKIVQFVLRVFGIDTSVINVGGNVEELRGAIEMHQGQDQEIRDQRAMLRSILDLADVDVYEVMVHRKNVVMINGDLPIEEIVEQSLSCPYTRIPIWKDNRENIVGVIHVRQLLKQLHANKGDFKNINIEDIMSDAWFIPETISLYDQLQSFRDRKEHFAVVVDEYGSLMGIVTLEDILEEIVGEIDDEHDVSMKGIRKIADDVYLIKGDVSIRDLNRSFDLELPEDEEYSTIAGLVLFESKILPKIGQRFSFYNLQFEIKRRQRNQITLISIKVPEKGGE